jgi:hypothetical protein
VIHETDIEGNFLKVVPVFKVYVLSFFSNTSIYGVLAILIPEHVALVKKSIGWNSVDLSFVASPIPSGKFLNGS